jgi:hypothetical protein
MPIFGITASSNMSIKLTDFYQIATTTLGSATSTVTFSSIPADYTHLQLRLFAQDVRATYGITEIRLTFNGDTSSIYTSHNMYGDGATASSNSTLNFSSIVLGDGTYGTSTGGTFGAGIADILDYTNTNKFKTVRHISGVDINGTIAGYGGRVGLSSGVWRSTTAISSITLTSNSLINFSANSRFDLYGVKA